MSNDIFETHGIKQLGYYVENLEEAARFFQDAFGAGPFVDLGVSELASCRVRGEDEPVCMHTALGHMNDIQIELIEVESDCPDPYKEQGHYGFHHFCLWVDDVDAAIAVCEATGMTKAMELVSGQGARVVYMDARDQIGHYIEFNAPMEQLWQGIKALHEKSDVGTPALIPMSVLFGG